MSRVLPVVVVCLAMLAEGACKRSAEDVTRYLNSAKTYTDAGEIAKARVELQQALRAAPTDPQVNLALAKNEEESGDLAAAFGHYVRAADPNANLIEAQLRVIELLTDSNQLQAALGRSNTTVGSFPNSADALAVRADVEQRLQQQQAASRDADAALRRDGQNHRALAVGARLRLEAKDVPGAEALVQRGLAKAPNDLQLLQIDAAIQLTQKQPEKAIETFRAIVRAAPHNVAAQRAFADLQADSGKIEDGLDSFRAAVAKDPNNQELQLAFVSFLVTRASLDDAVAYLRKLIDANPKNSSYDLVLTELYRERGDLAESRAVLNSAVKRLGDGKAAHDVRVAIAKLDLGAGQTAAAQKQLDTILSADPNDVEARITRASVAMLNGRNTDAISDLLAAVKADPVNGRAFQALAAAYVSNGQSALGIDAMRRAIAVTPGDGDAEINLAVFLQSGGALQESREIMSRLTLRQPGSPAVWLANARLAIERKDWLTASASVARLRTLPGQSQQADALDARAKLARGDAAGAYAMLTPLLQSPLGADPGLIGDYAKASVASNNIAEGVARLAQKAPTLTGSAAQSAWLAVMLMQADAGRFADVDKTFTTLSALAPTASLPYERYVDILLAKKQYPRARSVLETGIAAGAPEGTLLLKRGMVNEAAGDLAAALSDYRAAQIDNPSSLPAANNYGSILADQSPQDKAAIEEVRRRLVGFEQSNDPTLIDTIAWLDYRLGRNEEAKLLLSRIAASSSTNPQIRFHMAAVLLATGDRPGGMALLDTVKGLHFQGSNEAQELSAT